MFTLTQKISVWKSTKKETMPQIMHVWITCKQNEVTMATTVPRVKLHRAFAHPLGLLVGVNVLP